MTRRAVHAVAPARVPAAMVASTSGVLSSTLANWAGEFVRMLSGFVTPRLIDHRMSREALGIWDYGWSIRSYVALASAGPVSSAAHYVARYRDHPSELSRRLGAMLALVLYGTVASALITVGLTRLTSTLVNTQSAALLSEASNLVLCMGLSACLGMPTLIFGGVLVGHERFDLLNLVDALSDMFMIGAIIAAVLAEVGLTAMGLCVVTRDVLNGSAKYYLARRIAPDLRVRPRWADWTTFREITAFGVKTMVEAVAKVLQYQVGALVVSAFIGPAALALYSRPRALILTTTRFVMGFARVLVPAASALHDRRTPGALADLLVRSTQYGLYLALPPALLMLLFGQAIMRLWMGESYADNHVLLILVLGYLPLFAQQPTYHILLGLASHGLAGAASLIGAVAGAVMCVVFVAVFHWGIDGAALATAIPVFLVNLLVLPYAGCRAAGLSVVRYARESVVRPVLSVMPFAAVLVVARTCLDEAWLQLLVAAVFGGPVLMAVYWFTAMPDEVKRRVRRRIPRPWTRGSR